MKQTQSMQTFSTFSQQIERRFEMKKLQYVNPEVEYVLFDDEDILTASVVGDETATETEEETTTAYDADQVHDGSIFG